MAFVRRNRYIRQMTLLEVISEWSEGANSEIPQGLKSLREIFRHPSGTRCDFPLSRAARLKPYPSRLSCVPGDAAAWEEKCRGVAQQTGQAQQMVKGE
jgi:hypothetical protein